MKQKKNRNVRIQKHEKFMKELSKFVPQTIKRVLQDYKPKAPFKTKFQSVALFADISGFTNMSEKLSELPNSLGTEMLAENINTYLSLLVKEISSAGGDIFKFAGDALLVVWPPETDKFEDEEEQKKQLPDLVSRVIQCCISIQQQYGEMNNQAQLENGPPDDALTLRVKLGK